VAETSEDARQARPPQAGALSAAQLYGAILDQFPDVCVFVFDEELRYVLATGAALERLGWRAEDMVGLRATDTLGEADGAHLEGYLQAALAGETDSFEHPGTRVPGAIWANTVTPLRDPDGAVVGAMVVSRDVATLRGTEHEREVVEQEALAHALTAQFERWRRERLEFLVEVNDVLAGCADRREVMRAVTRAAVPRLGDWCAIYAFLDAANPVPAVEVAHVDPTMVAHAEDLLVRQFPYDPDAAAGVPMVVRTGRPEFLPDITDEMLGGAGAPAGAAVVANSLALRAAITVPLVKHQRVIGAMIFLLSGGERHYTPDDLTLAQALAGRVASSLDNRRLAELQRDIAHTLQRSLLPEDLPDIPGAEVAVRYWATGEATEIGGDFYDVFAVDDMTHAVVVGDVCGKGPKAAAVTGLARHTIRANAWRGDDHVAVLQHLNAALLRSRPVTLCTAAYATLSPTETRTRFTFACAGHPLPVLVRADGTASTIGQHSLLLGGFDTVSATTTTVELAPGDTVVLYTDGATDVRPPSTLSSEAMRELVASSVAGAVSAEDAVDRLFCALDGLKAFENREDDVALLLVRAIERAPGGSDC
jgi:PAS domain S-box-containing protein